MSEDRSIHIGRAGNIENSNIMTGDVRGDVSAGTQQTSTETLDAAQLAAELAQLRTILQGKITTTQEAIAVGAVAQAEESAKANNLSAALAHLATAGEWALQVASGMTINVAITALKRALGVG